jgi:ribosomal subunit interface protein
VDVVVKGRHTEVGDRLRSQAEAKLAKVAKLDAKVTRIDVEICEERNPRLADLRSRVELTCLTRGPIVRAEAAASDPFVALDLATAKLEARLRRAADRRRIHHGIKSPVSVAAATAPLSTANGSAPAAADADDDDAGDAQAFVVREKSHQAAPITLDQALFEMELVGHDFYLYVDSGSGLPSVVYRRRGYDYGVIRLVTTGGDAT